MGRKLEEIIEDFENNRISFKAFRDKKELNKATLLEYQARFVDIKAELRPYRKKLLGEVVKRDDKAATAIKFRIAIAIHEGELKDDKGKLIYEKCSINQAEKFASGSKKYKSFIDQRSFYKESYLNVSSLHSDCDGFINLIKDLLKY